MERIKNFLRLKRKDKALICRVSDLLKTGVNPKVIIQDFIRINQAVWDGITQTEYIWTEEMLESQFRICPEHIYCAFEAGKMVATASGFITNTCDLRQYKTWIEKTGNGFFSHHVPAGDIGFGADLSVMKGASPGTSDRLMLSLLFCSVLGHGVAALYLGSRIPSYHKHTEMKVEDYVFGKRKNEKPLDPELYFYCKDGFEIVEVIPEYMDDPESLNYGVLIRWKNPLYGITQTMPFLKPLIRVIGKLFLLRTPTKK